MKIEAGREYRTAGGKKEGPMTPSGDSVYPWANPSGTTWANDGRHCDEDDCQWDLVAEWSDPSQPVMEPLGREFEEVWDKNSGALYEDTPPQPVRQYFYKVRGCKAQNPDDADCICWHDEGIGPLASGKAVMGKLSWRDKPVTPAPKAADSEAKGPVEQPKTLRDEFAMAALTGLGQWCPYPVQNLNSPEAHKVRADWAYAEADAMMARRSDALRAGEEG